ncbi:hypothetical protein IWW48_002817 [Coemansia sp. RSA 1200]|nr:hypothetical protein IWW48_002817 [Coemansia sp. RSA 1200]
MSFSLTPEEEARVRLAELLGYTLDPISKKDMAMIIVISVVYGIDLLAVIYMLWNRHYPPLKSKSPLLMAFAYMSCVCWFIGDLQINGHVHLAGTALTNCKGVGVWVRVLLGVCTVSSLIALRSYGLFRVFRHNLPYNGFGFYLPFLAYCGCTLIYGIVAQVLSPKITVEYMPLLDICYCPKPFRAALYGYIWATWVLVALINWKIRNIKSSFNESREMTVSCVFVFIALTFNTVLQFKSPQYPFHQVQRIVTTSLDHLVTNLVWWTIIGGPLLNCLFRRQKHLGYWKAKLRKDGLQNEYDIESEETVFSSNHAQFRDSMDDFFLYADATADPSIMGGRKVPELLPNGEPRPKSARSARQPKKQNRNSKQGGLAYKRQSAQSARTLAQTKQTGQHSRAGSNADPFDIRPSLSRTTTSASTPPSSDPFNHRFSSNFYPLPPAPVVRSLATPHPNESQSVLPRVDSVGSSTTPPILGRVYMP